MLKEKRDKNWNAIPIACPKIVEAVLFASQKPLHTCFKTVKCDYM